MFKSDCNDIIYMFFLETNSYNTTQESILQYISPQEKGNDGEGMEILENIKHSIKYKQLFKQYYIRMYILTVLERKAIEP